jgi:hypothetical protein
MRSRFGVFASRILKMKKAEQVQWHDVQGLVLNSYQMLPFAAYVPWCFGSNDRQQAWL